MRHLKGKRKENKKVVGWKTEDGMVVKPDKNGRWPAVKVFRDKDGKKHTIVAGGHGNHPDEV